MYQFENWNANLLKLCHYLKRLFLGLNLFNFVLYKVVYQTPYIGV